MFLPKWELLPQEFKNDEVRYYYDILIKKKFNLFLKRTIDIVVALILLAIFWPVLLIISVVIKASSKGPALYKQKRVTQFGRVFSIYKFRTMVDNADKIGLHITPKDDPRINKVGKVLRKFRLDETAQLFNLLKGDITLVGTRPEVLEYVEHYSNEMYATLLLPAGITSPTSIIFKDEAKILSKFDDPNKAYIEKILPQKMKINLEYIKKFNIFYDIFVMFKTVLAVIK